MEILAIWLLIGLLTGVVVLVATHVAGKDVTLGDVMLAAVLSVLGPLFAAAMLIACVPWGRVVIRGRR